MAFISLQQFSCSDDNACTTHVFYFQRFDLIEYTTFLLFSTTAIHFRYSAISSDFHSLIQEDTIPGFAESFLLNFFRGTVGAEAEVPGKHLIRAHEQVVKTK